MKSINILWFVASICISSAFHLPEEDGGSDDFTHQIDDPLTVESLIRLVRSPQTGKEDDSEGGDAGRGRGGGGGGKRGQGNGGGGGAGRGGGGGGGGGKNGGGRRGQGNGGGGGGESALAPLDLGIYSKATISSENKDFVRQIPDPLTVKTLIRLVRSAQEEKKGRERADETDGAGRERRGSEGYGEGDFQDEAKEGEELSVLTESDTVKALTQDEILSAYKSLSRVARSPKEIEGDIKSEENDEQYKRVERSQMNQNAALLSEFEDAFNPVAETLSRITRAIEDGSSSQENGDKKTKKTKNKEKEHNKKSSEHEKKDKKKKGKKNKENEEGDVEPSTNPAELQMENGLGLSSSDYINSQVGREYLPLSRTARSLQGEPRIHKINNNGKMQEFNNLNLEIPGTPLSEFLQNTEFNFEDLDRVERSSEPEDFDAVLGLEDEEFPSRYKRDSDGNKCCGQNTLLNTTKEDEKHFPVCFKSREKGDESKEQDKQQKAHHKEHFRKFRQMHCVFNKSGVLNAEGKIKQENIKEFMHKRILEDWKQKLAEQYITNCTNFANTAHSQHHGGKQHTGKARSASFETDSSEEGEEVPHHKHHDKKQHHNKGTVGKFLWCIEKNIRKNCDPQYLREGEECKIPDFQKGYHHKDGKNKKNGGKHEDEGGDTSLEE